MIQFKFDHQYVSGIDALLKKQASARKEADTVQATTERKPIRLLPVDELPFSLEKRNPPETSSPKADGKTA